MITRFSSGGMPDSRMTELTDWMIIAPISEATMENRPPSRELPPITSARIASSSSQSPALLASAPLISAATITPAKAAQMPDET